MAAIAWSNRSASRARVIRVGNASSGIQLTPRTKTGMSLTDNENGVPCSSGVVSSRTERKPIRCDQLSRASPSGACRVTSIGWRVWSPYPRGHHSAGSRTVRVSTAVRWPAGTTTSARTPATAARTVSGTSATRSTSTCTSTRPSRPSMVTSGRTVASRAVDQACRPISCQMPAVTSVGPQSQPKLQAILRMKWNGSG